VLERLLDPRCGHGEHPAPLEIVGSATILGGVRVATLRFKPETALEEAAPA
jgi:hypothetical protein